MQRQRYRGVESNLFHQFLRLVTFYINMLMPKLFKHVNCSTNVISAFDKPCIPLKRSMKIWNHPETLCSIPSKSGTTLKHQEPLVYLLNLEPP